MRTAAVIAAAMAACAGTGPGEQLAMLPAGVRGLAIDSAGLYATTTDNGLYRIPLDGGAPEVLVGGSVPTLDDSPAPVLTPTEVLWVDSSAQQVKATSKTTRVTRVVASQAWQLPTVGCPAKGSSRPGLKMRTR